MLNNSKSEESKHDAVFAYSMLNSLPGFTYYTCKVIVMIQSSKAAVFPSVLLLVSLIYKRIDMQRSVSGPAKPAGLIVT